MVAPVECDAYPVAFFISMHTRGMTLRHNYAVLLEKQLVESIKYRTHFDSQFSISEKTCLRLETEYRESNRCAMSEPFFSRRQNICSLANSFADNNTTASYAYQCLADCHVFLQACITQNAIKKSYISLTIGEITYREEPLFNATRMTIQSALDRGISTQDEPQFHVWLTLADMTIIDFTINEHLRASGLSNNAREDQPSTSIWRPERRNELNYHPILIDDAFLTRLQKPAH